MAENLGGLEGLLGGNYFDVSFLGSDLKSYERGAEEVDILSSDGREKWFYHNMNKYLRGRAGSDWFTVITKWKNDLESAFERKQEASQTDPGQETAIEALKKKTISAMAVGSSARAMEGSAGSLEDYLKILARGDMGIQDTQDHLIVHNHPERISDLLGEPKINSIFLKIIDDMGIEKYTPWSGKEPSVLQLKDNVLDQFKKGKLPLVESMRIVGKRLDKYVEAKAKELGGDPVENFVNVRLAADIFLIDVFTNWGYELQLKIDSLSNGVEKDDLNKKLVDVQPKDNWGGDPLRVVLEPSFLPRRIKGVYSKGKVILDMLDLAFRPLDQYSLQDEIKPLSASMATHLKSLARFSKAVMEITGSSTAMGISNFSPKSIESLDAAVDLLFQVFGKGDVGKEMVGLMAARIIEVKALAAISTNAEPGFAEMIGIIMEDESKKDSPIPFGDVRKTLWGKNGRDGLLSNWASVRMGLRFNKESNRFGAAGHLKNAWTFLTTNAQTKEKQEAVKGAQKVSLVVDAMEAIYETFYQGRK